MLLSAVLIQYFWIKTSIGFDRELPFLSCLYYTDSVSGNMLLTMYTYFPFPFFLLYFSGEMRKIRYGYGILEAVRGSSRLILCVKTIGKTVLQIGGFVLIMCTLYTVGRDDAWRDVELHLQIYGAFLYALTVGTMVLLQFFLELYVGEQYANGALIIGGITTVFLSGAAGEKFSNLNLILFPNLAFATRNGVLGEPENAISFTTSIWVLSGILFLLIAVLLQSFSRKDMI